MLKENLTNLILFIDLIIFVVWPFLVFFHFIWIGLILLIGFSIIGASLYEIYKGFILMEHKVVHNKSH